MTTWDFVNDYLKKGARVALLYVISSEGSSPGRQGFSMTVDVNGNMAGSIGGGLMEQKLIELAKSHLKSQSNQPFLKRQIHRKDVPTDQSGMICSGEQTIAFYFLNSEDIDWVERLVQCLRQADSGVLSLSNSEINFKNRDAIEFQFVVSIQNEKDWNYKEQIGHRNTVYIVGGGHVGSALSEMMLKLGFFIEQIDDREGLNTMAQNLFAHKRTTMDYDDIERYILEGDQSYVVLVSFGYRTDKLILKRLLGKKFKYLGMMGSSEKVKKLFLELESEGIDRELLRTVHAPIGIPIQSKTPSEIAVSIAAQIISVKNAISGIA